MGWAFQTVTLCGECTIWFASPRMKNNFSILRDSRHLDEKQIWDSLTEDFIFGMELHAYADYFLKNLMDRKAWYIRNAILAGETEYTIRFD